MKSLTPVEQMFCSLCGREHRFKEYFDHCGEIQRQSRQEVDRDAIRERIQEDVCAAAAIAKATGAA